MLGYMSTLSTIYIEVFLKQKSGSATPLLKTLWWMNLILSLLRIKFKPLCNSNLFFSFLLSSSAVLFSSVIMDNASFSEIATSFYTSYLSLQLGCLMILTITQESSSLGSLSWPTLSQAKKICSLIYDSSVPLYMSLLQAPLTTSVWASKESDLICGSFPSNWNSA